MENCTCCSTCSGSSGVVISQLTNVTKTQRKSLQWQKNKWLNIHNLTNKSLKFSPNFISQCFSKKTSGGSALLQLRGLGVHGGHGGRRGQGAHGASLVGVPQGLPADGPSRWRQEGQVEDLQQGGTGNYFGVTFRLLRGKHGDMSRNKRDS